MISFSQCDIFPQLPHNWLYNYVYSISSTYTYSTVYNDSPQYTLFAVYICFLFTMWYFFTITAQLTLQQCRQHIRNIYIQYCLELFSTVYWLCCLYMLSFPQCDIFLNYYIIHSTTVFTAYPQHIHTALFTITVPSRLTLLYIFASFTQCDISHNYCTIDSTTIFPAFPQHIHTILFTITLPSRLTLLFI